MKKFEIQKVYLTKGRNGPIPVYRLPGRLSPTSIQDANIILKSFSRSVILPFCRFWYPGFPIIVEKIPYLWFEIWKKHNFWLAELYD